MHHQFDPILRRHPLTDEEVGWTFDRHYGCNSVIASEYLVTFRSAAAGFFDLTTGGGTANLGGFKSGCTSNLVVADGVLNAPDYTRTCTCSYQNQTSLAFIHMPDNETWTFTDLEPPEGERLKRLGINLGAPGDRMAPGGPGTPGELGAPGILWLDYPSVGGRSPDVPVFAGPAEPKWFRRHTSAVSGDGLRWVAASGAVGLTRLQVALAPGDAVAPSSYTVRLHFSDPEFGAPGRRVFDVTLQGRKVLRDLDVAAEAGGRLRPVVKEFRGVRVGSVLAIELTPRSGAQPVLSGVEAVEEHRGREAATPGR